MNKCVHCNVEPDWYYAKRTSVKRESPHYLLNGCVHAVKFGAARFADAAEQLLIEKEWDQYAREQYAKRTEHWDFVPLAFHRTYAK